MRQVRGAAVFLWLVGATCSACGPQPAAPAADAGPGAAAVADGGTVDAGSDAMAACAVLPNGDGQCSPDHPAEITGYPIDAQRRCRLPGETVGCGPAPHPDLTTCQFELATGVVWAINPTACMPEGLWRDCNDTSETQLFADSYDLPACP